MNTKIIFRVCGSPTLSQDLFCKNCGTRVKSLDEAFQKGLMLLKGKGHYKPCSGIVEPHHEELHFELFSSNHHFGFTPIHLGGFAMAKFQRQGSLGFPMLVPELGHVTSYIPFTALVSILPDLLKNLASCETLFVR